MCGRFAQRASAEEIARQFGLTDVPQFVPRYNISPGAQVLAVKPDGAALLKWAWRGKAHNLRGETAPTRLRCLIPADGFYEWRRVGSSKQPYYVRPAQDRLFGFAGVWDGDTCAILTVAANQVLRAIHHRMPAVIARERYAAWLAGQAGLLLPAPDESVSVHPVGAEINSGAAESPRLIEPLDSEVARRGHSGSLFGD
jgi:putative SOS response-associated peptidase YedK